MDVQEALKSEWEKVRASLKQEKVAAQSLLRNGRDAEWLHSREAFRQDRVDGKTSAARLAGSTSKAGMPPQKGFVCETLRRSMGRSGTCGDSFISILGSLMVFECEKRQDEGNEEGVNP